MWVKMPKKISEHLTVILPAIVGFLLLRAADAFEEVYEFSRRYEGYQIDELILTIPIANFVLLVVAHRRGLALKKEMKSRLTAQQRLVELSSIDAVTGLSNAVDALQRTDEECSKPNSSGTFLLFNLMGHEAVTRKFGMERGQAVLQAAGKRLAQTVPTDAIVGRIDSGLFSVFLPQVTWGETLDAEIALIRQAFSREIKTGEINVKLDLSSSSAEAPVDGIDGKSLYRKAAVAMTQPIPGRSEVNCRYNESMEGVWLGYFDLLSQLKKAIEKDEIYCAFQPVVDLSTGRVTRFEALARWVNQQGQEVSPGVFILLAEASGLINELSERLLRRAIAAAKLWPSDVVLSFNLSTVQLRDRDLPARIEGILLAEGFPSQRLELEITETAMMLDLELSTSVINALRKTGARISLDDFGVGFSNLGILLDISFDSLKIDMLFVAKMLRSKRDTEIVVSIIELAKKLGMSVTAEGVEDQVTVETLAKMGCDRGQGYFFAKALPAEQTGSFIQQNESSTRVWLHGERAVATP
jgi:EAL domain-containing protein (putative c-di-GMP-specific phosphodiesterase class I)/GGDEF domain-containing protein